MSVSTVKFLPVLESTIKKLTQTFSGISEERRKALAELAGYIRLKIRTGEKVKLIFICTHNSRRSHIAQAWAQTAAAYYGIKQVECYSGGTEATAFNPRAVKAMEEVGFRIEKTTEGDNPLYEVFFAEGFEPVKAFSKKYDDVFNPGQDFGAVMTCSHADENCPVVTGANMRISIPYDDPKDFDQTPQEAEKYRERVHQIGRELFYTFSLVEKSIA